LLKPAHPTPDITLTETRKLMASWMAQQLLPRSPPTMLCIHAHAMISFPPPQLSLLVSAIPTKARSDGLLLDNDEIDGNGGRRKLLDSIRQFRLDERGQRFDITSEEAHRATPHVKRDTFLSETYREVLKRTMYTNIS
jgi:hypothetical protein